MCQFWTCLSLAEARHHLWRSFDESKSWAPPVGHCHHTHPLQGWGEGKPLYNCHRLIRGLRAKWKNKWRLSASSWSFQMADKADKKKKLRCLSLRVFIYPPALATSAYQLSCIRKEAQTKYIFHYQQPKHRSNYLKNNRCPYNNFTVSKHSL